MDNRIIEYYSKRVTDPGGVYGPPEIQADFAWVTPWLQENVAGSYVLELACGNGHWTRVASETAGRILATDINTNLVQAARTTTPGDRVNFLVADAYQLPLRPNMFDCGLLSFWLSHVPRAAIPEFLNRLVRHLRMGGRLLFIDARWVEGYRPPAVSRDEDGNTFELRTLRDGSRYEILKNYLTEQEWVGFLESFGKVEVRELSYLWAVRVSI